MVSAKAIVVPRVGTVMRSMRRITTDMVGQWRYGALCAAVGDGVQSGTNMRVVAVRTTPAERWVSLELPNRSPRAYLRLTLKEMSGLFRR